MIILLGGSGYVGTAFRELFDSREIAYLSVSRATTNHYDPVHLTRIIQETGAHFLINAAGFTGKPNVDACESSKTECLEGNAVLPGKIQSACLSAGIPWGHVSSGCIYNGKRSDGRGFKETDKSNFSFRAGPCSFYSGTKALGEEILKDARNCYIWRLRIPFDRRDHPRNYLSKLLSYPRLLEAENSLSHLGDFIAACFHCWENKLPFGIYNLTNHGSVSTSEITGLIQLHFWPAREFKFFTDVEQFMREAVIAPRSNCVLDTTKARLMGIPLRPVKEALIDSIRNWQSQLTK